MLYCCYLCTFVKLVMRNKDICCACLKQKPGIPTSYVVVFMCH